MRFARTAPRRETPLDDARRRAAELDLGAPVAIRLSARARRISLRVTGGERGVELVLPRAASIEAGLTFLVQQRGWVAARVAALPAPAPFVDGAIVPVRGVPHLIRHEAARGAPPVAIAEGEIRVGGDPAHIGRRVRDHLVRLAREELSARARACAERLGRKIGRIGVRDPSSRWGSCSSAGNLSFSWRLVMAPDAVIDYVVAHEVAHLAEMNHSARFWRLVETLAPDSAAPRAWLRRHRQRLLSYG
ncbi:MAG TPA: SprT family zinc-dependent metalloprotease [Stellaceae bacterium]|nr:SprT family zinc-dependent metalloprotease [Stellaceae bacterium]